jgi:hypothetical protein
MLTPAPYVYSPKRTRSNGPFLAGRMTVVIRNRLQDRSGLGKLLALGPRSTGEHTKAVCKDQSEPYSIPATRTTWVYLTRHGVFSMTSPIRPNAFHVSDIDALQLSPTLYGRALQAAADSNLPQHHSGMKEGTGCASRPVESCASCMRCSAGTPERSSRVREYGTQPVLGPLGCVQAHIGLAGLLLSRDDTGQSSR